MISRITTDISALIRMFTQWAEAVQAKARSPTELGSGAVIYILIAAPLVVVAAYELVTILTNLFRIRSNDRAPLMAHADGLMKEKAKGIGYTMPWRGFTFMRFGHRKKMTEAQLLAAYKKARRKRERAEEDKLPKVKQLSRARGHEMEMAFKLGNLLYAGRKLNSRHEGAMSKAVEMPELSKGTAESIGGALAVPGANALAKRVADGMIQRAGGTGMSVYEERPYVNMSDGPYAHLSGNVYEKVKSEEPAEDAEAPKIIDTEGHTVGEGEYLGPA